MAGMVYLLLDGSSDQRQVQGAFSTRAAAEAALHLCDSDGFVLEVPLDGPLPEGPPGHSIWNVQEYKGYGVTRLSAFWDYEAGQVVAEEDCYEVEVWALDESHALQLGVELIERFKAQQSE